MDSGHFYKGLYAERAVPLHTRCNMAISVQHDLPAAKQIMEDLASLVCSFSGLFCHLFGRIAAALAVFLFNS